MTTLISAPIAGFKQYSLGDWIAWIENQEDPDIKVCLTTNGRDSLTLKAELEKIKITHKTGKEIPLIVVDLPHSEKNTIIQNITYARELCRRTAKKENCEYLLFLDTDTIPYNLNTIQILKSTGKEAVSGLYFYKNSKEPVAIDEDTGTNFNLNKLEEAYTERKTIPAWGFGFGCFLMHKNVFSKYEFDYELFGECRTDDFGYIELLHRNGVKTWIHPYIMCKHLASNDNFHKLNEATEILINKEEN